MLLVLAILLIIPSLAHSKPHKFKYLKLSPLMQERMDILENGNYENVSEVPPIPDDDNSDLFNKIKSWLYPRYRSIGRTQTDAIYRQNQRYDLGTQNFQAFSWHRPMGIFVIGCNRAVAPISNGPKRWIVRDVFTVSVGAVSFLKYLKSQNLIDIPLDDIGLFAGIGFQRTYRFSHYANNYMEGLKSDFKKLFLTFLYFNPKKVLALDDKESIYQQDFFGANTGIFAKVPIWGALSAQAGFVLASNKTSSVKLLT